jgi:hypothetical protein
MAKMGESWESLPVEISEERWEPIAPDVELFRRAENDPVRIIITGRRNHKVGAFWSWKNMAHIAHESEGEEKCCRLFDCHPLVGHYFGQPEQIRFRLQDGTRIARYTPDFLIMLAGRPIRLEYKRVIDLRPPSPVRDDDERGWYRYAKAAKVRARLREIRAAYTSAGLVWRLITDVDLAQMANLETVDEIIANCGRKADGQEIKRLVTFLQASDNQSATVAECEAQFHNSDFPKGDLLARIPERLIALELDAPITEQTIVRLTGMGHDEREVASFP